MKTLIILRGCPGSGKSTFAKTLGGAHFETDMYFVSDDGTYNFDPSKLREAHNWCQNNVHTAMIENNTSGINKTIVVSNTFTQEWEMKPYFDMAKEWGYQVFSIIVENRHNNTNVHNVPSEKVQQMKDRFEIKL